MNKREGLFVTTAVCGSALAGCKNHTILYHIDSLIVILYFWLNRKWHLKQFFLNIGLQSITLINIEFSFPLYYFIHCLLFLFVWEKGFTARNGRSLMAVMRFLSQVNEILKSFKFLLTFIAKNDNLSKNLHI